jgi:hypothetical protein
MTNTARQRFKAALLTKTTEEVQRLYDATYFVLYNETYGSDNEARYDDMDELSCLHKELKRRKENGESKPLLVWCDLCQVEVSDCLHRKMARKLGLRMI